MGIVEHLFLGEADAGGWATGRRGL